VLCGIVSKIRVAKIGGEVVPNRWSGKSKCTVAESGVGALKYATPAPLVLQPHGAV